MPSCWLSQVIGQVCFQITIWSSQMPLTTDSPPDGSEISHLQLVPRAMSGPE
jgi:hypothetical protein